MNNEKLEQLTHEFIQKGGLPLSFEKVVYEMDTNMLWIPLHATTQRIPRYKMEEISGAINHLIRKMVEATNSTCTFLPLLIVDIDGVEKKKIENLRAIAHMMAERSKFFKSKIELDPMPASSRKIIHEFLQSRPYVITNSIGDGEQRRVVIEYVDAPPENSL